MKGLANIKLDENLRIELIDLMDDAIKAAEEKHFSPPEFTSVQKAPVCFGLFKKEKSVLDFSKIIEFNSENALVYFDYFRAIPSVILTDKFRIIQNLVGLLRVSNELILSSEYAQVLDDCISVLNGESEL